MSVLWQKELCDNPTWKSLPVNYFADHGAADASPPFHLRLFGQGTDAVVALLSPLELPVYVNGDYLIGGLRILQNQDEILAGLQRYYYSAESTPLVSVYQLAPGGRRPKCGVCRGVIEDGQSVVVCHRCGRVFHQLLAGENLPAKECWTYRAKCLCDHPTDLGEGATWRPEQEECCD